MGTNSDHRSPRREAHPPLVLGHRSSSNRVKKPRRLDLNLSLRCNELRGRTGGQGPTMLSCDAPRGGSGVLSSLVWIYPRTSGAPPGFHSRGTSEDDRRSRRPTLVKWKPGRGGSKNFLSQHMWKTLGTKPLTPEERRHIAEYLYGEREWGRCSGSPTRSRSALSLIHI